VSLARYKLGSYIPEDDILLNICRPRSSIEPITEANKVTNLSVFPDYWSGTSTCKQFRFPTFSKATTGILCETFINP
jgi:hypothetical protein